MIVECHQIKGLAQAWWGWGRGWGESLWNRTIDLPMSCAKPLIWLHVNGAARQLYLSQKWSTLLVLICATTLQRKKESVFGDAIYDFVGLTNLWRCAQHAASPIDYLWFSLEYMGLYVFNWPISVLGDWKDIFISHVIIIIKSKVSTFSIVFIFFRVVCLRCLLHHIMSLIAYTFRENQEFVFIIIVLFMMSANIWIQFGLQIELVCSYPTSGTSCSEIRARYHPNPTPDRWPLESLPLGSETGIQVTAVVGIGDHLGAATSGFSPGPRFYCFRRHICHKQICQAFVQSDWSGILQNST